MLASAHAEQGVLCKACSYSLAKAAEGVASKQNQRKKYKIIIILYFLSWLIKALYFIFFEPGLPVITYRQAYYTDSIGGKP